MYERQRRIARRSRVITGRTCSGTTITSSSSPSSLISIEKRPEEDRSFHIPTIVVSPIIEPEKELRRKVSFEPTKHMIHPFINHRKQSLLTPSSTLKVPTVFGMELLNTHHYDGGLKIRMEEEIWLRNGIEIISKLTNEERYSITQEIRRYIQDKLSPKALTFFDMIANSIKSDSRANYDPSNNLDAGILLCLCKDKLYNDAGEINEDFIAVLNIQLEDMSTGSCPQGRTHRLFQSLVSFCMSADST